MINLKDKLHAALSEAAKQPDLLALCMSVQLAHLFEDCTKTCPEWTWLASDSFVCARACGASMRDPQQQVYAVLWADESGLAQWQDDLRMLRSLSAGLLRVALCGPSAEQYMADWQQQDCAENIQCSVLPVQTPQDTPTDPAQKTATDKRSEKSAGKPAERPAEKTTDDPQTTRTDFCWRVSPSHYQWQLQDSALLEKDPQALRKHICEGFSTIENGIQADQRFPLEAGGLIAWAQLAAQGRLLLLDVAWDELTDPRIRAQFAAIVESGLPIKCLLHGEQSFESASFFADLQGLWLHYPADALEAHGYWQQDLCHNWPSVLSLPAAPKKFCIGLEPSEGDFRLRIPSNEAVGAADQDHAPNHVGSDALYVICTPTMYETCIAAQTALSRIEIVVNIRVLSNVLPTPKLEFPDGASVLMVDAYAQPYLLRRFQRQMVEKNWKTTRILDGFACGGNSPAVADIAAALRSLAKN